MIFHRKTVAGAFSLIELLVAMAVLTLMTVLLAQMLQSTSQSWLGGQARANNFAKARSMLDLMARDVQSGVFRPDLGIFAGANPGQPLTNMAFYTMRPGVPAAAGTQLRSVSLVQYGVDSASVLRRGDLAIPWDGAAAAKITFGTTNALPELAGIVSRETVSGVVGFQILFMQRDGTLAGTYDPSLSGKGIAIGMAVVDDTTLKRLEAAGKLDDLQAALAGSITGTNSVKTEWDALLKTDFKWGDYPPHLARGLKIFERYVVFP